MSETKWTEGPWVKGPANTNAGKSAGAIGICSDTWTVADVQTDFESESPGEPIGNANLIVAAPELYEALEQALDRMEMIAQMRYVQGMPSVTAAIEFAHVAMRKARGEVSQ